MSDVDINVTYLTIRSALKARAPVIATLQIRSDLLVDIDPTGRVLGVERIGGVVDIGDLQAILSDERFRAIGNRSTEEKP